MRREHPDLAEALLQALGRRLRKLISTLEAVSLPHVPSRVAYALLEFAERVGQDKPQGQFKIPMTQTQLAAQLATTRESVARALAALREASVMEQRGRTVTARGLGALQAAADPHSTSVTSRP